MEVSEITGLIEENNRRRTLLAQPYDPETGRGAPGERFLFEVKGLKTLHLPTTMKSEKLIVDIMQCKDIDTYIKRHIGATPSPSLRSKTCERLERLRLRHDFPFWAARHAFIKRKGGGDDITFILNRPQRKMVELFERMRANGRPIRVICLKARQWGGSTCSQLYMAWLQLTASTGLNSLIIAHQRSATDEIKDMFDRLMQHYPSKLLCEEDCEPTGKENKLSPVGRSGSAFRLESRNCKIKIGTAERPDSCRGGDYNLVHLSEVGVWKKTLGKQPEDIVRSACSGILLAPMTMIVYESTANGTGNFFHREYESARSGESQFSPLFVAWHEIEQYAVPLSDEEARQLAKTLIERRDAASARNEREEPGKYLWWLWQQGVTLEAIKWYIGERAKFRDHGQMASEYPSDDVEAFAHSGARVFDRYCVERLRKTCTLPRYRGEIYGKEDSGAATLENLEFVETAAGELCVWQKPESEDEEIVTDRYLVVVDIGGRSDKADWSVIAVFDRLFMSEGGRPVIAAQWRGHIDIDILAWKAARIAAYYNNALLVIESNTLETHDRERYVDGDQSLFILNQIREVYPNLYARKRSEDDIRAGIPTKYGFHTNVCTKPMIISSLIRIVRDALYVERCREATDELTQYERRQNGSYGAISGCHDDILMTRAIGLHICFHEMETPRIIKRTSHRTDRGSSSRFINEATIG